MKQQTFAAGDFERFRKPTRRGQFLLEMNKMVPWKELCKRIEPFYPRVGNGRPPVGLEWMLRIYFLQHWFNLSAPGAEEALYESRSMCRFVGIDLGREPVPDETTILNFRHLLEQHQLGERLFQAVGEYLQERGLRIASGTIVDASKFHQEQGQGARPGDALHEQGQAVVLRHEGAHRRGQQNQTDSFSGGHGGQRT